MKIVQLDQEIDARHLVRACENEGKVTAYRLPTELKNKEDPDVLGALIPKGNPILSADWDFAHDWPAFIPNLHPGILIVGQDDDDPYFDTHVGQRIVFDFKQSFPLWNVLAWDNSIVHIQPSYVTVWHCEDHRLVRDEMISRADDDWQERLEAHLAANARRTPPRLA